MSWDLFVQDLPAEAKTVRDIPPDFKPRLIGKRTDIITAIQAVVPIADFSNPSWGVIDGDGWSIEINIGDKEECRGFAFHIRGGDAAIGVVDAILKRLNLRAIAPGSDSGFFEPGPKAVQSFEKWRAYRDQIASRES